MDRNPTEPNRLLSAYRAQIRAFIRYIRWTREQRADGGDGGIADEMMVAMMRGEFNRCRAIAKEWR